MNQRIALGEIFQNFDIDHNDHLELDEFLEMFIQNYISNIYDKHTNVDIGNLMGKNEVSNYETFTGRNRLSSDRDSKDKGMNKTNSSMGINGTSEGYTTLSKGFTHVKYKKDNNEVFTKKELAEIKVYLRKKFKSFFLKTIGGLQLSLEEFVN